jgi:hypothetical protein
VDQDHHAHHRQDAGEQATDDRDVVVEVVVEADALPP